MGALLEQYLGRAGIATGGPATPDPKPALEIALPTNPDQNAKNRRLSQQTGAPLEAVEGAPEYVDAFARRANIDRLLADAPTTTAFVAQPENAKLAHDDIESLTAIERLSRAFERGRTIHAKGAAGWELGRTRSIQAQQNLQALDQRLKALGEENDSFVGWLGVVSETVGQMYASIAMPKLSVRVGAGATLGATLGAVGGPLAPVTAAAGAGVGAGAGVLSHFLVDATEQSVGHAYVDMLEQGVDKNTAWGVALGVGVINGALETGAAAVALKPFAAAGRAILKQGLLKAVRGATVKEAAKKFAVGYGSTMAAEVFTEVAQESVEIVGAEIAKSITANPTTEITLDEATERMTEVAIKTFKAMSVLAAPGPGARFATDVAAARRAREDKAALDDIQQALANSKLAERAPDKAVEHLAAAMTKAGLPEVFMPADKLNEYIASAGLDPTEVYNSLGVANQIEEALAIGGDVKISAQAFAGNVMLSQDYKALSEHIRTSETGMTPAEAQQLKDEGLQEQVPEAENAAPVQINEKQRAILSGAGFAPAEIAQMSAEDVKALTAGEAPTVQAAAQRAVTIAEFELGLKGLFQTAADAGLTENQYASYLLAVKRAAEAGRKRQAAKLLRQQERALSEDWKREREDVRSEVQEEVNNRPVWAAVNGVGRERLDRAAVKAILGERMKELPRQGTRSIFTEPKVAGIDPEAYAHLYDFPDAKTMLKAILDAGDIKEIVERETDAKMLERHGDLLDKQQAVRAALESLHTDNTAEVLAFEMNQLRQAKKEKRITAAMVRQEARSRLQKYKIGEINPDKFLAAERRYAKIAAQLVRKGDRQGAARAKFHQLMNFQYAREAFDILERVEAEKKYLVKFTRPRKAWKQLPADYLESIREVLAEFQFGAALADSKREKLLKWAHDQATKNGTPVQLDPRLLDKRTHWESLALEDWDNLVATVKSLHHWGKMEQTMLLETEKRTRDFIASTVATRIYGNLKTNAARITERRLERVKGAAREFKLMLLSAETVLRQIDGFKDLGPAYLAIKGGYDRAISSGYQPGQIGYNPRSQKAAKEVVRLFSVFSKKERFAMNEEVKISGLTTPLSRQRMLSVMLNLGNADNRQALIDSGQFTDTDLLLIANQGTKKDWDFVQSVWDYLDGFWPEVSATVRRREGRIPEKVIATPVVTPHGTYSGGYYPLRYDRKEGVLEAAKSTQEMEDQIRFGAFVGSHTRNGHTKARDGSGGRPVKLDLFTLNAHVDQVIYDLEVGDAVSDAYRILNHPKVRQAFSETRNVATYDALQLWFGDIVTGEMRMNNPTENALRWLRAGFTVSKLAYNVGTASLQFLGLFQSSVALGKAEVAYGLRMVLTHPKTAFKTVAEASEFMRARQYHFHKDISDAMRLLSGSTFERILPGKSAEWLYNAGFWGMKKAQYFVDTVTWIAAQRKGMTLFDGDFDQAVLYADRKVATAQASGIFGDRTTFERGTVSNKIRQTEYVRTWSVFLSYFAAKLNVAYARTGQTNFRNPLQVASWATDMALLFTVEAVLAAIIRGQLPDDDDEFWQNFGLMAVRESVGTFAAGVPGVRELWSAAVGFNSGGVFGAAARSTGKVVEQLSQGEADDAAFRALANFFGIFFRIPGTGQIGKTGSTFIRAAEGDDVEAIEFIMGPKFNQ